MKVKGFNPTNEDLFAGARDFGGVLAKLELAATACSPRAYPHIA